MNIQKVINTLVKIFSAEETMHEVVGLVGSPGVGKTSGMEEVGRILGIPYEEIRVAEYESVDFRGALYLDAEKRLATFFDSALWKRACEEAVLLCFDEFTQATPDMVSPLMKIFLGRSIGGWTLHPGTRIVWTGNRVEDRAGCSRIPSALRERSILINVGVDASDWLRWYKEQPSCNDDVVAYIEANPARLHEFDGSRDENQPSPRSWEKVGRVVRVDDDTEVIGGIIGAVEAKQFLAWRRENRSTVSVAEVVADRSKMPTKPMEVTMFAKSLASSIASKEFSDDELLQIVDSLPESYQVVCLKNVSKIDKRALRRSTWRPVVAKHSKVLTS